MFNKKEIKFLRESVLLNTELISANRSIVSELSSKVDTLVNKIEALEKYLEIRFVQQEEQLTTTYSDGKINGAIHNIYSAHYISTKKEDTPVKKSTKEIANRWDKQVKQDTKKVLNKKKK